MKRISILSLLLFLFLSYVFFSSKQIADIRKQKSTVIVHDTIVVIDTILKNELNEAKDNEFNKKIIKGYSFEEFPLRKTLAIYKSTIDSLINHEVELENRCNLYENKIAQLSSRVARCEDWNPGCNYYFNGTYYSSSFEYKSDTCRYSIHLSRIRISMCVENGINSHFDVVGGFESLSKCKALLTYLPGAELFGSYRSIKSQSIKDSIFIQYIAYNHDIFENNSMNKIYKYALFKGLRQTGVVVGDLILSKYFAETFSNKEKQILICKIKLD